MRCQTCDRDTELLEGRCIHCWKNGYEVLFAQRNCAWEDLADAEAALAALTETVNDIGRRRKIVVHGGIDHQIGYDCKACAFLAKRKQERERQSLVAPAAHHNEQ